MSIIYLTRKETFSASHRLHAKSLSDAENRDLFGKCNSLNGHGHNYGLEITLRGTADPRSGILYNLTELKKILHTEVLQKVDHSHLNLDVPEFRDLNPTAENIAVVVWKWLESALPKNLLYEVKINETEKNLAIYRGER